jgi:hypothetical protein
MIPKPDETLEEIWTIRRQIAKKFAADPRKRVAYYQRIQRNSGSKIYRPDVPASAGLHAPAVLYDRTRATATTSPCAKHTSYRASRKQKAKPAQ